MQIAPGLRPRAGRCFLNLGDFVIFGRCIPRHLVRANGASVLRRAQALRKEHKLESGMGERP
ncbi:hypothetical protein JCM14124_25790 [Humidesulfovibrio idahonensis]